MQIELDRLRREESDAGKRLVTWTVVTATQGDVRVAADHVELIDGALVFFDGTGQADQAFGPGQWIEWYRAAD